MLVYDVTDCNSFYHIDDWMSDLKSNTDLDIHRLLVANKCDNIIEPGSRPRVVTTQMGQKMAQKYNMPYIETSAKDNYNVNKAFQTIGKETFLYNLSKTNKNILLQDNTISIPTTTNSKQNKNCC